jgi:hypothetical protein
MSAAQRETVAALAKKDGLKTRVQHHWNSALVQQAQGK